MSSVKGISMKLIVPFVFLFILTHAAFAQEAVVASAPPPNTIGADAIAVVPVGDYARAASFGIGAAARLEIPVGPGSITGHFGAIFHAMNTSGGSLTMLPIYAGYRFPLGGSGVYLAGELGLTIIFASVDTPLGTMSDSDTELGAALMAGFRHGALDLRAGLFAPDIDDAVGVMASAGYDFVAF